MNVWANTVITDKGLALLSKLTQGNTLQITEAVTGAGFVTPGLLQKQTEVSDPKRPLNFHPVSYPEAGKCAITMSLSNAGLSTGYKATQIGVFATDPDEGKILFFIAQSVDAANGTNIPSEDEMAGYAAEWVFYFSYGQAASVEVTVDPSNTVSRQEMENRLTEKADKVHNHDAATQTTPGMMSVEDKKKLDGIEEGATKYSHPTHTAQPNALYKVTVDGAGHVTGVKKVTKEDITALGIPGEAGGKRTARLTVGTSASGWTAKDCDYLCDGTADEVEINAAIAALPDTGGEIVLLDGTYNIAAQITSSKASVTITGNGASTKLVRAYEDTSGGLVHMTGGYTTIRDLFVYGAEIKGNGIYLTGNVSTAENCIVHSANGYGIYIAGSHSLVKGCRVYAASYGIYASGSECTVAENVCDHCSWYGIYSYGDHNIITGNTCRFNQNTNIYMRFGDYCVVTNNNVNTFSGDDVIPIRAAILLETYIDRCYLIGNQVGEGTIEDNGNNNILGYAPAYTYGTEDMTAGSSFLETGTLYFVYE